MKSESLLLFFIQNGLFKFCKARVRIPYITVAITENTYKYFSHGDTSLRERSETPVTASIDLCPKNGRNKNIPILQSISPKTRSRTVFFFCLPSSSAIFKSSLPERSSSTVIEKYFAISLSESIFGYPLPDSHFETAVRDTYSFSASSSCVSPFCFLSS